MSNNDELIILQRQITEALQKKVLSTLGVPEYRSHLEALGYSVRLLSRLNTLDTERQMLARECEKPARINEY